LCAGVNGAWGINVRSWGTNRTSRLFRPTSASRRERARSSPPLTLVRSARNRCPTGKSAKNLSTPLAKNIPLVPSGKSALPACAVPPGKGALRDRHERGLGCGGRGSVGRERSFAGRSSVSERRRAGRTALLPPSLKLRRKGTKPGEASWRRRVAYGKTVWSRHPLLVPSCRWRRRSDRIDPPSSRQRR
jgi:hypothetical protein